MLDWSDGFHRPFPSDQSAAHQKGRFMNRRQRLRKQRLAFAAKLCEEESDLQRTKRLRPTELVVAYIRESNPKKLVNLDDQNFNVRREIKRQGAKLKKLFPYAGSGRLDHGDFAEWERACRYAKRHNIRLVVETLNRIARPSSYSKTNQKVRLSQKELARLSGGAEIVPLFDDERSAQTKRGGRPEQKHPGRMKERKARYLPRVLKLHRKGFSLRQIHGKTDIPIETSRRWIKQAEQNG
jgi:hypothetical protein